MFSGSHGTGSYTIENTPVAIRITDYAFRYVEWITPDGIELLQSPEVAKTALEWISYGDGYNEQRLLNACVDELLGTRAIDYYFQKH